MKRYFIVAVLAVLAFGFSRSALAADQGVELGTTINRFDVDIAPGSSSTQKLNIINSSGDRPLPVHVQLNLWSIGDENGQENILFAPPEEGLDATKWFTVNPTDFIVEANNTRQVAFDIKPPTDAPAGSYLVMMRFIPRLPEQYFENEGPRFIPELGVLVFLNIRPLTLEGDTTKFGAVIESFGPGSRTGSALLSWLLPKSAEASVFDSAVRELVARVRNTGIYHFKASGSVVIRNMFGYVVETVEIPDRYLLPGKTRSVAIRVSPDLSADTPWYKRVTHWLRDQTYLGPYTATIVLTVPSANRNDAPTLITDTLGFWIIPWKLILIVAFVLLLVFFLYFRRGRFVLAYRALTRIHKK